jgi:hypothetical protein
MDSTAEDAALAVCVVVKAFSELSGALLLTTVSALEAKVLGSDEKTLVSRLRALLLVATCKNTQVILR